MCPVSGINNHNPQDRSRQSLATVWDHTHPYYCHSMAPQALWYISMVWEAQEKPSVKADLAIYTHVLGVPGQYKSVALMLSHKMDFNCCASRDSFHKSNHIYICMYKCTYICSMKLYMPIWLCMQLLWIFFTGSMSICV